MPLFEQAPRFSFKLHSNPVKMARSLKKLLNDVMTLLATHAQLFVINHDSIDYRRQLTAEGGFFTVLVRPPGDWAAVAPVLLAFSLRDLYLVGYLDNAAGGIWKLYNDAYLIGSGAHDPANANNWQCLNYRGGYNEQMSHMPIGMALMYFALQTINNPASNDTAIRLALGVYIIVIPEACRFPRWKRSLVNLLRESDAVIFSEQNDRMDVHFTHWSIICKRVRRGPARFIPGHGFASYKELIEVVSVVLSRPPIHEL